MSSHNVYSLRNIFWPLGRSALQTTDSACYASYPLLTQLLSLHFAAAQNCERKKVPEHHILYDIPGRIIFYPRYHPHCRHPRLPLFMHVTCAADCPTLKIPDLIALPVSLLFKQSAPECSLLSPSLHRHSQSVMPNSCQVSETESPSSLFDGEILAQFFFQRKLFFKFFSCNFPIIWYNV